MSMYVSAVILRRCLGVMPYDIKFQNDISEWIWKEVDVDWLAYYSSICMGGLRKPVADVGLDSLTVFWSEEMVLNTSLTLMYVPALFLDGKACELCKYLERGTPTLRWLVPRWIDTYVRTNIFMPIRYVRLSHSHDYMKIHRRFGKETIVNSYQKTTILIFTTSLSAWILSTPELLELLWDPPNLYSTDTRGGGGGREREGLGVNLTTHLHLY
jgi:hypothetical protein